MKTPASIVLCTAVALALAACSTTGSRIRERQALFDSYPEHVQQNLHSGVIEVGYTPEMVLIALGEPDRKADVVTPDGDSQLWTWWRSSPGIGFGVGSWSSLGSRGGLGTGVSIGGRPQRDQEAVVEFVSGRVRHFERLSAR